MGAYGGEDFGLFDGVDAEVGFEVEVEATESQDHATEIGRDAQDGGYDLVVAFGGDGTINEVVNGLAGTDIPVTFLPGGNTNVVCRTLGIPNDVVDATEHLLSLADDFSPRKIDLGLVEDRYFVFSCGAGIDATVVKRVDKNPKLKSTAGPWYYSWAALSGYYRNYLRNPVKIEATVGERVETGITADDVVVWSCLACRTDGQISNWQGSFWDLNQGMPSR